MSGHVWIIRGGLLHPRWRWLRWHERLWLCWKRRALSPVWEQCITCGVSRDAAERFGWPCRTPTGSNPLEEI